VASARIPVTQIASVAHLATHLARHRDLHGATVQSVDLTGAAPILQDTDVRGALFLGCTMPASLENDLTDRGALVFPPLPALPFNPYRASLYTPAELYDALDAGYAGTCDARCFAWYRGLSSPPDVAANVAMSLHDFAIGDALDELFARLDAARTVGLLGGHAARRGGKVYARTARLASRLVHEGFTIATGGGPGAMEAANLGARFATGGTGPLEDALARLAAVPDARDVTAWARCGLAVARDVPTPGVSLGIPTWFYGHEPPNPFATHVAKYFSNALREDELLRRARGGLVFSPGAAGTVQEVFQAATGAYYASEDVVTPLVLVGRDYWTHTLPAWPLLAALGAGRTMGDRVLLTDDDDAVVAFLRSF